MNLTIQPSRLHGTVTVPSSKSVAHRALIAAALAGEGGCVYHLPQGADVLATLRALSALGVSWERTGNAVRVARGVPPFAAGAPLSCGESGSTLRFLLPLCLLDGKERCLEAAPTLLARPMGVYETVCRERGFLYAAGAGGIRVAGCLSAGDYTIPGNISSQFASGLLFALPLLPGDSVLHLLPPVESVPYLHMTEAVLSAFGVSVCRTADGYRIPGAQRYIPADVTVPGDASGAANFLALRALGQEVTVVGNDESGLQGDAVAENYLAALRSPGAVLDVQNCPDLAPILLVVAALTHGGRLRGTRRLAYKESDRARSMAEELQKCGCFVTVEENAIFVTGGARAPSVPLASHGDHRVAMALGVLLCLVGGTLTGAEAVEKSMPDFFSRLRALGAVTEETE